MPPFKVVALLMIATSVTGCGGASTSGGGTNGGGGGGVVTTPPPRPMAAVSTANEIAGLSGQAVPVNAASRTGTATLSGLVAAELTSGGTGNRALLGESTLSVNFDSLAVSGSATNFAEVVSTTNSGQISVTQWVQSLNGTLSQTGRIANSPNGSVLTLTTSGTLTGTLSIEGQNVSGTYQVNANANTLGLLRKGTTTYAVGGLGPDQNSDLEVTFTPNGGAPIRVCIDNLCPDTGTGLSALHVLKLN